MKTATAFRRTLTTLTIGATGAVFALAGTATAAASNPNATTQSFQISPPTANYSGDAGSTQKGTIKVTNLTDNPLSVRVGKQNFVAKGEEGEIELVDDANPLYSLSPWFNFSAGQLDIGPKASKELNYSMAIPANAEPGGRYGSIVFSSIAPKLPSGQSGAAVQQTIAGIAFLRINGQAKEELKVESFQPKKGFSEYGPEALITRVKNTGNVHEKPTGSLVIKNMFGMKVASVKLDEHFVIPGAIRRLTNDWPAGKHKPFLIGNYTVELNATYAGGKTLTADTSFFVLPYKQVGLALLLLIILILILKKGRRRLARAVRILAGRE